MVCGQKDDKDSSRIDSYLSKSPIEMNYPRGMFSSLTISSEKLLLLVISIGTFLLPVRIADNIIFGKWTVVVFAQRNGKVAFRDIHGPMTANVFNAPENRHPPLLPPFFLSKGCLCFVSATVEANRIHCSSNCPKCPPARILYLDPMI